MNRWNDSEFGDDYRGGERGLGFRNYDRSRYANRYDRNNGVQRGYDDRERDEHPLYYTDDRGREYMGPWTERGYERNDRPGNEQMYDQHRAERYRYGEYGADHDRSDRYYDDRYHGRDNDRYREYYIEHRNPRFDRGERFGESHQHHYHARTSDNWDRPAAYNAGGYGTDDFGRHGNDGRYSEDDYWNRDRRRYDDRGGYEDYGNERRRRW